MCLSAAALADLAASTKSKSKSNDQQEAKQTNKNERRATERNKRHGSTVNAKRWQNFEQGIETKLESRLNVQNRRGGSLDSHTTHSNTKHPPIHTTSIPLKHFLQLFTFPVCGVEYARTHTRAVNS